MVVTGEGLTAYIYLPDPNRPSQTTCTADCANDWPPIPWTTSTPKVEGIDMGRIGSVTRPGGSRQITLDGYPLYRFAADQKPGDVRGESVGNTWFAIGPDGNFLPLPPVGFEPAGQQSAALLHVINTPVGPVVADADGQTLYTYQDDTASESACTAQWCVQDWPPLLVKQSPTPINGIHAPLGVLTRPDGTLQVTLGGHALYRFAGDQRPGDVRGQGIGGDWYPISLDGIKLTASGSSLGRSP
jgi:predicted lipoprotein with Yx(FWY)xxD motif